MLALSCPPQAFVRAVVARLEEDRERGTRSSGKDAKDIIFYAGPNLKPWNIAFMVELPLLAKHVDEHRSGRRSAKGGLHISESP